MPIDIDQANREGNARTIAKKYKIPYEEALKAVEASAAGTRDVTSILADPSFQSALSSEGRLSIQQVEGGFEEEYLLETPEEQLSTAQILERRAREAIQAGRPEAVSVREPETITDPETGELVPNPKAGQLLPQFALGAPPSLQEQLQEYLPTIGAPGIGAREQLGVGAEFGRAREAVGALEERAFGTEPSKWANLLLQQQRMEEATGRDVTQRLGATEATRAMSRLAERGGLGGGERERIARGGARTTAERLQELRRGGAQQRLGIRTEEERQRLGLQERIPGLRLGLEQYETGLAEREAERGVTREVGEEERRFAQEAQLAGVQAGALGQDIAAQRQQELINLQTRLGDVTQGNIDKLLGYQQALKTYGAGQTAEAIEEQGKK